MASWESRFWPARRWLADRLVGHHAYSKNLFADPWFEISGRTFNSTRGEGIRFHDCKLIDMGRNPQETA